MFWPGKTTICLINKIQANNLFTEIEEKFVTTAL